MTLEIAGFIDFYAEKVSWNFNVVLTGGNLVAILVQLKKKIFADLYFL